MRSRKWLAFSVAVVVAIGVIGAFPASAAAVTPTPTGQPLVMENGHQVGWVSVAHVGGKTGAGELWVTYRLDPLALGPCNDEEDWGLVAINLAVGQQLCSIPTRHGNPAVCEFPWKQRFRTPVEEYTVVVPLKDTDITNGNLVYFAAQAVIAECEGHCRHHRTVRKTIWAQGQRFPHSHCDWGMYFTMSCTNPNP